MINRVLLRIKIIQIIYAYYKGDVKSIPLAEKELFYSIDRSYDLYIHLLQLSIEVTQYAEQKIDARKHKLRPTEEDLNPNTRFIDNLFVKQLRENVELKEYIQSHKLSWAIYDDTVKMIYNLIVESDDYQKYMTNESNSYKDDKELWRKIYKKTIFHSEEFHNAIEDQSIYWTNDLEIVISFITKTIKQKFDENSEANQSLLPKYNDEEDKKYIRELLHHTLKNEKEYTELIGKFSTNWDIERIAFMDTVILQTALAELTNFPTIPVNVTLNEYIEIAKNYSTEKSANFINGVLDNIVKELKAENKLLKVVRM